LTLAGERGERARIQIEIAALIYSRKTSLKMRAQAFQVSVALTQEPQAFADYLAGSLVEARLDFIVHHPLQFRRQGNVQYELTITKFVIGEGRRRWAALPISTVHDGMRSQVYEA
jgi:hypothetical protein